MMRYTAGFVHARHEYIVCARRDIARDPGHIHYWVAPVSHVLDENSSGVAALFPTIREADAVIALFDTVDADWRVTTRHLTAVSDGRYRLSFP